MIATAIAIPVASSGQVVPPDVREPGARLRRSNYLKLPLYEEFTRLARD